MPRSEIFVTTKFFPQGKAGAAVRQAMEGSLAKLGLDYVDLYLIHAPRNKAVRREQWEMLESLRDEGLTKSIGVSNYGIHHLQELLGHARIKPVVNQVLCKLCCDTQLNKFSFRLRSTRTSLALN
jgi:diketogulonate reductase-like aldo/keto reductase